MAKLTDGREIRCPLGRAGDCGQSVFCTVEQHLIDKNLNRRSVAGFCTSEGYEECPTFVAFEEFNRTQAEESRQAQRAQEIEEDLDNEVLEEYEEK